MTAVFNGDGLVHGEAPAAPQALPESLDSLRTSVHQVWTAGVRGGAGTKRIRPRPHNDTTARHLSTATKPVGARPNGRPSMPTQQVPADRPVLPGSDTAVLPLITRQRRDGGLNVPGGTGAEHPCGHPDLPDPGDAAHEAWGLVERAQKGDAAAFGLIYDRYVDNVFRFIYFRVGNRPLAEDLTSETFLRALKRIGTFTWQGRDLGAWLVTIARNLVTDHFKSGRYRLEVTTGDVLDADREDRGVEGSPESAVIDHITNVVLLTAVKQLNPEQQECIVLRFLLGFSVAETARAMRKNEGAIKALQYRAVRALARLLPEGFQT